MAACWIAPLTSSAGLSPEHLHRLLHRHLPQPGAIEHLIVRRTDDGVLVFGFLLTKSATEARRTLRALIEQTLAAEPELRLWRVI